MIFIIPCFPALVIHILIYTFSQQLFSDSVSKSVIVPYLDETCFFCRITMGLVRVVSAYLLESFIFISIHFVIFKTDSNKMTAEELASLQLRLQNSLKIQVC